jgi:hypothetical protein
VDTAPAMPDDYSMKAYPKQMVDAAGSEDGAQLLDDVADQESVGDHTIMGNLTDTQ